MARIAVIGAGMGAMAAAARLAVAGHRVAVFERTETYGGGVRRFARDGFAFDTGPGLLPLPAVYRDLFVKTGKQPLEECVELVQVDPAVRHVFADGTSVALPNVSRAGVVEALDAAFGAPAGERWGAFLNRARDTWDRCRRPLLEEPLWPNWEVLAERDPYPAVRRSGLLRRRPPTFAEVTRRELAEPHLVALVESSLLAHGLDPRTTPASAAVLPYLEQAFGTWYVRGGIRELARAVYERCRARRVEFSFGAEVVSVVEKDGRAAGVELADGTRVEADHVVAGIDPLRLQQLTAHRLQAEGDVQPAEGAERSGARFTVLLALRGAREAGAVHRTVVHPAGRKAELDALASGPAAGVRPTVTVLRPGDPALTPDAEHESVVLSAVAPSRQVLADPAGTQAYADQLVSAAESAIPGLRERIIWRELPDGPPASAAPPALAGAGERFLYPSNATRLAGLHLVGGSAHPGGGLPHSGMSGALVAGLIVEGPEFRGSQ
ncbi:NAD(P)/FAD-dependent oxidoreductase [Streptomyces sp. B-S-A8]|uniref:NAD(P)/FAD-dependent oxidoreductase n=1 Tax=Streptomyces solicavernae TaxID=3043614 RepID=A0ABT6RRS1_9ACTN|nr:NAD(P)/FAD-dependent oxidoreductase [Streptomyces sp. B-S-A8]MDI3387137.1 NAD(P)/FAD-dependent oxidoreductase [Streptomyces sp. B-S-A8]